MPSPIPYVEDFCRTIAYADAYDVRGVGRENAVRLYASGPGPTWALQVRTPMRVKGGREGAAFIVATASLDTDDLRALREVIDKHLAYRESLREATASDLNAPTEP